ncbi:hypothetical protein ACWDYH_04930 [Nocardia goodfellowii]|uniref:Uncharacterized membrane protein YgaE (UPF0421/DUF939 family) n=1 Tax=Nocardia goodfellowii TaxID=882446 RepID=A0ABS4QA74_9NOCA|nr:hypothetical protein [Nocardia goodfellowii]MBP2188598.1 uncharacterized membrane protein YgaE (UPF0421/DUF939 family) [Nocardia goodfellowii]
MNTIQRLACTVLGAVVAVLLIVGFGGVASAEPPPAPVAAAEAVAPAATPVAACMAPGDSLELRGAIAAVLGSTVGAILGVPVLLFGAIPGAIIGGVVGFMIGSAWYAVDAGQAPQGC